MTAFAEDEYSYLGDFWGDDATGDMEITGHFNSSCVISIPETVDATIQGTNAKVTFSEIDLEEGYKVAVYVTNIIDERYIQIPHTSRINTFANCIIYSDYRSTFLTQEDNMLASLEYYAEGYGNTEQRDFTVTLVNGPAGNYRGTMQYEVKIEPIGD